MIKIEFHPEAERELLAATSWYRERSKLAARAFATDIAASLRSIATWPERWPETRRANDVLFSRYSLFQFFIALSQT